MGDLNNYFYTTLIIMERCFVAFCWQLRQEKVHFPLCNKDSWNLSRPMNVALQGKNIL